MKIFKSDLETGLLVLVLTIAILFVTHGGQGYARSSIILISGFSILVAVVVYRYLTLARCNLDHLYKVHGLILFILLPPFLAEVYLFQTIKTMEFYVANSLVFSLCFLILQIYVKPDKLIVKILLFLGCVSGILAIYLYFSPLNIFGISLGGREGYFRLVGTFSTANRFSEFPALAVVMILYTLMNSSGASRTGKMILLLLLTFLCGVVLWGGSKGVIVALLVSLVYLVTRKFGNSKNAASKLRYIFIFALGLTIPYYYFEEEILVATKIDRITDSEYDPTDSRISIWAESLEYYSESSVFFQLFGHGGDAHYRLMGLDAHSMYFDLLINYGLVAIISIAIFLLGLLKYKKYYRPEIYSLSVALVIFCLVRGVSMPTILNGVNGAMLAFWFGVSILLTERLRAGLYKSAPAVIVAAQAGT